MEYSPAIRDAVDGLYATFSGYPLPDSTDPCPCCHTRDEELLLHARPLRELAWENLEPYIYSALMTWGDAPIFKHFLPRIMELFFASSLAETTYDAEMLFAKFRFANWRDWPHVEQIAVERLLQSVWVQAMAEAPNWTRFADVESWLCSIAQCEEDLTPYLSQWLLDERLSSSVALSGFLLQSGIAQSGNADRNAFWNGREAQYTQLKNWVRTPEVAEKLKAAERNCGDETLAAEFAAARGIAN